MHTLSGRQARYLRALGHHLKPVVTVGKNEVDEAVRLEVDRQLAVHELIKVKILDNCLLDRREVAPLLAEAADAAVAQVLGRVILLYRPAEEPRIQLP